MEQLVRSGPAKLPSSAAAPPSEPFTPALSTARAYSLFGWHGAPPSTDPGALGNVLYCTLCGAARMLGSPDKHTAVMAQRAADAAAQAAALRGTTLGTPGPLRLGGTGGPVQVASGPAQTIAGGALQCSPGQAGTPREKGPGHTASTVASLDKDARPASTAWQPGHGNQLVSASSFTTWMAGFGSGVASSAPASPAPPRGPFGGRGASAPLFGVAAMRASTSHKRSASPGEDDSARCVDGYTVGHVVVHTGRIDRPAKRAHAEGAADEQHDRQEAPSIPPSSVVGVFDPIAHHRSFCPWVASPKGVYIYRRACTWSVSRRLLYHAGTDVSMCGWRATLDALVPGADVHGAVHGVVEEGGDDAGAEAWSATRALKAILPKLHMRI